MVTITLDISEQRIAELMTTAIESSDPVTVASRGGWCDGINLIAGGEAHDSWYADPELYGKQYVLEIIEVDDDADDTKHRIGPREVVHGLTVMATKFPHLFEQVMTGDIDGPCADIFLQCVIFGEEKYA